MKGKKWKWVGTSNQKNVRKKMNGKVLFDMSYKLVIFQEYFIKHIGKGKPLKEVQILKEALYRLMDRIYKKHANNRTNR